MKRTTLLALCICLLPAVLGAQAKPAPRRTPAPKATPTPKPESTPPPGWQTQELKTGMRLSRPAQEQERSMLELRRAELAIVCETASLKLTFAPAITYVQMDRKEPVLLRFDQDKAAEAHLTGSPFSTASFSESDRLVRSLLAHHWLLLRYVASGYKEVTFNVTGLASALEPHEATCGLAAGSVAAAAATRPASPWPSPPPAAVDESHEGAWTAVSRLNRFDDSLTVAISVPSRTPFGKDAKDGE